MDPTARHFRFKFTVSVCASIHDIQKELVRECFKVPFGVSIYTVSQDAEVEAKVEGRQSGAEPVTRDFAITGQTQILGVTALDEYPILDLLAFPNKVPHALSESVT